MASEPERRSPLSSSGGVQKHRACDECRSRKLACSKEPDGCSRCRREGLRCHYSVQKPMGRPRKRRNVDEEQQDERQRTSPLRPQKKDRNPQRQQNQYGQHRKPSADAVPFSNGDGLLPQAMPTNSHHITEFPGYDQSTIMSMDPSISFLEHQRPDENINFLDILPPDYAATTLSHDTPPILPTTESISQGSSQFGIDLGGVDLMGGIGFQHQSTLGSAPPRSAATRIMHNSFDRYMAKTWDSQPTDTLTSTTTPSSDAQGSSTTSTYLRPNPNISCGCLSSLYLTLDCLGNLPADIPAAIRTVRNASRVAHSTIRCEFCSSSALVDDATRPVPIQTFQNLMLLAALVPSACNAYAMILERVDQEADRARRNGEDLWFSFRDIGGHWGMEAEDGKDCLVMQSYNERKMPPDMWRAAMREIIRADVDGVSGVNSLDSQDQKGLRDVIKALEERSHRRHARMDAAFAMGHMPHPSVIIPPTSRPVPPEERHCMRVLDAARMALDNLVIA
ncbi:hypothetical protein NLU13_2129 [Sarocladium strictum]|uniref:Zn(2)-C6 fungal-type domain-containing protein n=1 Tax=Sarocladium strictum TaxID=5046 RepID=A0AA39GU71_SARSR|nr:hypothetical protein NLU13_2129 [Sarocladium strictum]